MSDEERKELARKIEVMQAALDGKEIECQWRGKSQWVDCLPVACHFEWSEWDYRVKPDGFEAWVEANRWTFDKEKIQIGPFCVNVNAARVIWDAAMKAAKEGK